MLALARFGKHFLRLALGAALTLAFLRPACAQPAQLPPGVLDLSSNWRIHTGDNPAWASTNFDDRSWPVIDLASRLGHEQSGWRWYRRRITLPPQQSPLSLYLYAPHNDYEVYVDGQRLPGASILRELYSCANAENSFPLPSSGGDLEIAIRARFPHMDADVYGIAVAQAAVGGASDVGTQRTAAHHQRILALLPTIALNGALILGGIGTILLYLLRRESREYLWLGLYLICGAGSNVLYICGNWSAFPLSINTCFGDPLGYPAVVFQIQFTYAFARRPVDRWMRGYQILMLAALVAPVLEIIGLIPPLTYIGIEEILNVPAAVVLPILLLIWFLRGNREAGWLIVPSLFPSAGTIYNDFTFGSQVYFGSVPLSAADLANFIFLLAVGIVMALRFTRVSRQQARAAAEFEAARAVQQVLVPVENPAIPGFRIDGLYLPAGEVGGDFYQVVPTPSGGVLAVVGDVSGKGMPAAMTVSLLIGTFRTLAHYTQSPAEILNAMNQRMIARQHGGFTTCLVLRIDPDGTLTAANAGHIPPYMDGREQTLDCGLPLGLNEKADYTETNLVLSPGAQLTLLTDGVIEAMSSTRELFGFDRPAAVSTQPAEAIAHAAQQFGQNDDITVVTLQFSPASAFPATSATAISRLPSAISGMSR